MTGYEKVLFKKKLEDLTEKELLQTISRYLKGISILLAVIFFVILTNYLSGIFQ